MKRREFLPSSILDIFVYFLRKSSDEILEHHVGDLKLQLDHRDDIIAKLQIELKLLKTDYDRLLSQVNAYVPSIS